MSDRLPNGYARIDVIFRNWLVTTPIDMESGVNRGQVISLSLLMNKKIGFPVEVHGVSPFSAVRNAVSRYREDIDYYADVLANCKHFSSKEPHLLRAYSNIAP